LAPWVRMPHHSVRIILHAIAELPAVAVLWHMLVVWCFPTCGMVVCIWVYSKFSICACGHFARRRSISIVFQFSEVWSWCC
jgi:hypothetical protein